MSRKEVASTGDMLENTERSYCQLLQPDDSKTKTLRECRGSQSYQTIFQILMINVNIIVQEGL